MTVGSAGRVTVAGTTKLPGARTSAKVLSATRTATAAGTLRIPLRLSSAARRALAAHRSLTVRLDVRHAQVTGVRRQTLRLPGAARAARPVHSSTRSR